MGAYYNVVYNPTEKKIVIEDVFILDQSGPYQGEPNKVADPSFDPVSTTFVADGPTTIDVSINSCTTSATTFTIQESDWPNIINTPRLASVSNYSQLGGKGVANNDLLIDIPAPSGMNIWTVQLTINYSGVLNGAITSDYSDVYIQHLFIDVDDHCKCKIYKHDFENKSVTNNYDNIISYEALKNINDCPGLITEACDVLICLNKICKDATNCNC